MRIIPAKSFGLVASCESGQGLNVSFYAIDIVIVIVIVGISINVSFSFSFTVSVIVIVIVVYLSSKWNNRCNCNNVKAKQKCYLPLCPKIKYTTKQPNKQTTKAAENSQKQANGVRAKCEACVCVCECL